VVFVPQVFRNAYPSRDGDRKTKPIGTIGSVISLFGAIDYQRNNDMNHKLDNILSSKAYILHMQVLLECCYI
jgi:hypothetical protein